MFTIKAILSFFSYNTISDIFKFENFIENKQKKLRTFFELKKKDVGLNKYHHSIFNILKIK